MGHIPTAKQKVLKWWIWNSIQDSAAILLILLTYKIKFSWISKKIFHSIVHGLNIGVNEWNWKNINVYSSLNFFCKASLYRTCCSVHNIEGLFAEIEKNMGSVECLFIDLDIVCLVLVRWISSYERNSEKSTEKRHILKKFRTLVMAIPILFFALTKAFFSKETI